MATLAGSIIGGSLAGPPGAFVGAFAGSLIDNFLLFPLLFPKPTMSGPKLQDLQVSTASEGDPIKWVIGPFNRVGGEVIWVPKKEDGSVAWDEITDTQKIGKGGGGTKVENTRYFIDIAVALCDARGLAPVRVRKIWANTTLIYDGGETSPYYDVLRLYDGTQTTPDPLMESHEGAGEVPAYLGMAYFTIERLALEDFSNRIPSFSALVEQSDDLSVASAVSLVLKRWGYDESEFDVSQVPGCFRGMVASGPQAGTELLGQIMVAYGLGYREDGDVIRVFPRASQPAIEVPAADLAAHDPGEDADRVVTVGDVNDWELPGRVDVRFFDIERSLQQGSRHQFRAVFPSGNSVTYDFPMSLTAAEARTIAARELWAAEAERQTMEVRLPASYLGLLEGDRLSVTIDDEEYDILVTRLRRGSNYEMRLSGVAVQPHIYDQSQLDFDIDPGDFGVPLYEPPETEGVILDLPALISDHVGVIGVYWGVARAKDDERLWKGAQLWIGTTPTGEFESVGSAPVEVVLGVTESGLSEAPHLYLDRRSRLLVRLHRGTLGSVSLDTMLRGANRAAVKTASGDWEIIGFQSAELIESGLYELSTFMRGLRGTHPLIPDHLHSGADFVLLRSDSSVQFLSAGLSLGLTRYAKFPALQGDLDDYDARVHTVLASPVKPLPPAHLEYEFASGSKDLTVNWVRRSKRFGPLVGAGSGLLATDESPETYEVDFLGGFLGFDNLLRTKTVTGDDWTVTYDEGEQFDDNFGFPMDIIQVRVYQISQEVGRGFPAEVLAIR